MLRFLTRIATFLVAAAIGLLAAVLLVPRSMIGWAGFIGVVVVFALLQSLLTPFIISMASKHAPTLIGAAGLLSTTIALIAATVVFDDFTIRGTSAWVLTPVIVWLVTLIATMLLPKVFTRTQPRVEGARQGGMPTTS